MGTISDDSLVAVGVGGAASVERARATNEERSRAGLARAPEQARRRDIGLVTVKASTQSSDSSTPIFGIKFSRLNTSDLLLHSVQLSARVLSTKYAESNISYKQEHCPKERGKKNHAKSVSHIG